MKVLLIIIGAIVIWTLPLHAADSFAPGKPNRIAFAPAEARSGGILSLRTPKKQAVCPLSTQPVLDP